MKAQVVEASLWVVGAHGGSAETTVASLGEGWRSARHAWPALAPGMIAPCVLVARTHASGLLAARDALTQWASDSTGATVHLLGLVLVADAPSRLPAPLRDLAKVVSGGAPRTWTIPWVEDWRVGDPPWAAPPPSVRRLATTLGSLAAAAPRR